MLKNYSLGVVSALIDIDYVRWMQLSFPELRYYSLDSYCQSNPKLAYKSKPIAYRRPVQAFRDNVSPDTQVD